MTTKTKKLETFSQKAYEYARKCAEGKAHAPRYVKKQAEDFIKVWEGKDDKYVLNRKRLTKIVKVLMLLKMHKGLKAGKPVAEVLTGQQWLFITAPLCIVYRDNPKKRRYEKCVLEIARKNGKTFIIGLLFILLFFLEPPFSKFFSVAPDGTLSRLVQEAIRELITVNIKVLPTAGTNKKFDIKRDSIKCVVTDNTYVPLNYSNSRLDGREPSVFLIDEVGALPNGYAIEAMASGQLTILNKLGFIVSTKYPTANNPFEDEVTYCKRVLDGVIEDETVFSLLYEPDNTKDWATDDEILKQANPIALDNTAVWKNLLKKRSEAIEMESKRENFLTKHCNIIYQGAGTEAYIPIDTVKRCSEESIDFTGQTVYVGVDLSMTNDNCAVALAFEDDTDVYADIIAFIPEGRIEEKNKFEHIDYRQFIEATKCIACGDRTVDYSVIEKFVFDIEKNYGCTIAGIGYDRYNALSSAQKWDEVYNTVEVRQHSDTLHPPTKLLYELCENKKFHYVKNKLLEINFENARCTFDTNLNRYVNKKKSNGKVDMVVALINAIYLLQQDVLLSVDDFVVQ